MGQDPNDNCELLKFLVSNGNPYLFIEVTFGVWYCFVVF